MADSQTPQEEGESAAELWAVVGLDAAEGEREAVEERGHGAADGGGGALGEDSGSQDAAAVVYQGELVASFGQVHEVHLASFSGEGLGVAGPDGLGLAGMEDEGTGPLEDAVDAAQAAGDEAGLSEVGMEAANAQAELSVSAADDVQYPALQSVRAPPRPFGAV
jgi:hypothetical protein